MKHHAYRQGLRHRLAQLFLRVLGQTQTHDQSTQQTAQQATQQRGAGVMRWLLTSAQTRAQYTQSARHQADGIQSSPGDPDANQQGRQYQQFLQQHQERMRHHGRY